LIFAHNLCKCRSIFEIISPIYSQADSPCTCDRNFHLTFTTLLHYLVKFEIQNRKFIQRMTSSFLFHMLIDGISEMCVMFKLHDRNVLRQLRCGLAVLRHSRLQRQSLVDQGRLKAKFHYTDPARTHTGPHGLCRRPARTQRSFSETRPAKKSVRVRSGPV